MKTQKTWCERSLKSKYSHNITIAGSLCAKEGYYSAFYSEKGKYICLIPSVDEQSGEVHVYPIKNSKSGAVGIAHEQVVYKIFELLKPKKPDYNIHIRVDGERILFYVNYGKIDLNYTDDLTKLEIRKTGHPLSYYKKDYHSTLYETSFGINKDFDIMDGYYTLFEHTDDNNLYLKWDEEGKVRLSRAFCDWSGWYEGWYRITAKHFLEALKERGVKKGDHLNIETYSDGIRVIIP